MKTSNLTADTNIEILKTLKEISESIKKFSENLFSSPSKSATIELSSCDAAKEKIASIVIANGGSIEIKSKPAAAECSSLDAAKREIASIVIENGGSIDVDRFEYECTISGFNYPIELRYIQIVGDDVQLIDDESTLHHLHEIATSDVLNIRDMLNIAFRLKKVPEWSLEDDRYHPTENDFD